MKTIMRFKGIPQDDSQAAWIPVVITLIHYFLGEPDRESSIAERVAKYHQQTCNQTRPQANLCLDSLLHLHNLRWLATRKNQPLTWQQIVIEIDAERPFVVACNSTYYYICIGYDPVGHMLLLYNPLPIGRGRLESIPYQDYIALFNVECLYRFHTF